MNKKLFVFAFVFVIISAFTAYALSSMGAFDSDGGINPIVNGTCYDNNGPHRDACVGFFPGDETLKEWYVVNDTQDPYCDYVLLDCENYGRTCGAGAVIDN